MDFGGQGFEDGVGGGGSYGVWIEGCTEVCGDRGVRSGGAPGVFSKGSRHILSISYEKVSVGQDHTLVHYILTQSRLGAIIPVQHKGGWSLKGFCARL